MLFIPKSAPLLPLNYQTMLCHVPKQIFVSVPSVGSLLKNEALRYLSNELWQNDAMWLETNPQIFISTKVFFLGRKVLVGHQHPVILKLLMERNKLSRASLMLQHTPQSNKMNVDCGIRNLWQIKKSIDLLEE